MSGLKCKKCRTPIHGMTASLQAVCPCPDVPPAFNLFESCMPVETSMEPDGTTLYRVSTPGRENLCKGHASDDDNWAVAMARSCLVMRACFPSTPFPSDEKMMTLQEHEQNVRERESNACDMVDDMATGSSWVQDIKGKDELFWTELMDPTEFYSRRIGCQHPDQYHEYLIIWMFLQQGAIRLMAGGVKAMRGLRSISEMMHNRSIDHIQTEDESEQDTEPEETVPESPKKRRRRDPVIPETPPRSTV